MGRVQMKTWKAVLLGSMLVAAAFEAHANRGAPDPHPNIITMTSDVGETSNICNSAKEDCQVQAGMSVTLTGDYTAGVRTSTIDSVKFTGLTDGDVYTLAWVVFNNAAACANPGDIGNACSAAGALKQRWTAKLRFHTRT